MKSITTKLILSFGIVFCFLSNSSAQELSPASLSPVEQALAQRHASYTLEGLEKLVGDRASLVEQLLLVRRNEQPPFVGVRATKLLIKLSDDAQVLEALRDDVENYKGLARVIATHCDSAPTAQARLGLARAAIDRAESKVDFQPYARALLESSDSEVARLARESFAQ